MAAVAPSAITTTTAISGSSPMAKSYRKAKKARKRVMRPQLRTPERLGGRAYGIERKNGERRAERRDDHGEERQSGSDGQRRAPAAGQTGGEDDRDGFDAFDGARDEHREKEQDVATHRH